MSVNLTNAAQRAEAMKEPNRIRRCNEMYRLIEATGTLAFEKALIQVDRECLLSYIED